MSRVEERLTNDYFDITLIGSEGLAVSGRGNNAWNAYVAALNILNAKILFSKSNLLVSKLFEPGTDGKRKSLEKHHLFPKAYLKALGYNDAKINQMANYAFIDWKDNMEILDLLMVDCQWTLNGSWIRLLSVSVRYFLAMPTSHVPMKIVVHRYFFTVLVTCLLSN